MTSAQYNNFKSRLERRGFEYFPDQPYDGRNTWMKFLVKKEGCKAFIRIDEYRHEDLDNGKVSYHLKPHGVVRDDECSLVLSREFKDLDLDNIEQTVQSYYNKLFND